MAKRWITEEEFNELSNKFQEGGDVQSNPLMEFFKQLPSELQEKIQLLPPEKQQEVLMQLMQRGQQSQYSRGGKIDFSNYMYSPTGKLFTSEQQYDMYNNFYNPLKTSPIQNIYFNKKVKFEEGGETEEIPVEAEKNENVTVQDGQEPQVEGGYLEQQSHNPVTGQSTYEIPDNEHNNAHGETGNGSSQEGVNMELTEGDVINSNKTKITTDFKIYGRNFKNKTFKEASDFLSKKETKIQKDYAEMVKEGKTDKVSDGALQIMLAKLGKNRNELNELQEQVLESKKQKEHNILMDDQVAKYGKIVLEVDKAKEGLNVTMDRYLNYMSKGGKVTTASAKKAQNNVYQSFKKFENFADQVLSNPDLSIYDIQQRYRNSGLTPLTTRDNTSYYSPTFKPINKSKIIGDFKSLIAREETGGWSNPYIAIAGVSEKEAAVKSFKELQAKAASSAIGKYQFVWNIHKNDIARVTGVKDPDAFRNNPQAQEKFMDWFRDTQLLPQATQLKQRYQLPLSIEKVMAMIHLEGKAGLEKKIKSGTLKTSTMANNFKNASPLDYAQGFEHGGYASKGIKIPKLGFQAINQFENTKGTAQGTSMQMGDNYAQSQEDVISDFILTSIGEDTWNKMPDNLKTQVYSYIFNRGAKPDVWKGLATAIDPNAVYKGHADIDEARRALDFNKSLQIIKNADFSKPEIYNNYIDQVLPQQYQSIADNYDPGFDDKSAIPRNVEQYYYHNPKDNRWYVDSSKSLADPKLNLPTTLENFQIGQQIYKNTWQNRAKDINQIYSGLNPVANTLITSSSNSSGTTPIVSRPNPFSIWKGDKSGINKADYTVDDLDYIAKTYFPNKKYTSNQELQQDILDYLGDDYSKYVIPTPKGTITGKNLTRSLVDNKFGDDWNAAIKLLKENSPVSVPVPNFKFDPYITKDINDAPIDNRNDLNKNKLRPTATEQTEEDTTTTPEANNQNKQASWMDKLKYGIRESAPYLRNIALMREEQFNPVLQQKPYDNPYDNMRTDYSIQSNLNDNQNALLTTIADTRGNPSVRNARLAQLAANTQNINNQLYTQKYNQELSLENQKQVGQSQYRNQLDDTNRNLRKQFEQEVLQTREVARQQKNMAIDNMMNTFLRKQEEDQALKLSLMNTNWDWDKYRQEFVNNPEKAKAQFNYLKTIYKMQGGKDDLSKLAPPGYELEQSYKLVKKKAPATE